LRWNSWNWRALIFEKCALMSSHGIAKGIKAGGGASAAGTRVSGGACAVAALCGRLISAQIRAW